MAENEVKTSVVSEETLGGFGKVLDLVTKHGFGKMILATIFFVFFSWMVYLAINPGYIFERYNEYISEKHNASIDYRMESTPLIRTYLNQLAAEANAERAYILEFHNGKANPSGLQWQFGDLTFINDGTDDISDEIQNVSLSRYTFATMIHDKGYWAGGIDELKDIDERFYNRMRLNDGVYFAFQMIYGANMREIGILGISYVAEPEDGIDRNLALRSVHKYASCISPLLDESNVGKK